MVSDNFLYLVGAVILLSVTYTYFFGREAVVKRKIRKANSLNIGSFMDDEPGKIVGEVKYHGKTLVAPLSKRKCVFYHVLIEQEGLGENASWDTILDEEVAGDVILKDGQHYALIDKSLIKSYVVQDVNYSSGFLNDAPASFENYLARHGLSSTDFLGFNRRTRYKEGVLEEGELVAVAGKGKWKLAKEVQVQIPAARILVVGPNGNEPVYITDDPSATAKE